MADDDDPRADLVDWASLNLLDETCIVGNPVTVLWNCDASKLGDARLRLMLHDDDDAAWSLETSLCTLDLASGPVSARDQLEGVAVIEADLLAANHFYTIRLVAGDDLLARIEGLLVEDAPVSADAQADDAREPEPEPGEADDPPVAAEYEPPFATYRWFAYEGFVVTEVVVVRRDAGERPPEGFIEVSKNLNAGNKDTGDFRLAFRLQPLTEVESYVTELGVIFTDTEDELEDNAEMLELTVAGESAELNGGEGDHDVFLYIVRSLAGDEDAPAPLCDITVLDHALEDAIPPGFERVAYTPSGFDADCNGGTTGHDIYLAFRRAGVQPLFTGNVLAIRDMYSRSLSFEEEYEIAWDEGIHADECFEVTVISTSPVRVTFRNYNGMFLALSEARRAVFRSPTSTAECVFELGSCGGLYALRSPAGLFFNFGDESDRPSAKPAFFDLVGAITELAVCAKVSAGRVLAEQGFMCLDKDMNKGTDAAYLMLWYRRCAAEPARPLLSLNVVRAPKPVESESDEDAGSPAATTAPAAVAAAAAAAAVPVPATPTSSERIEARRMAFEEQLQHEAPAAAAAAADTDTGSAPAPSSKPPTEIALYTRLGDEPNWPADAWHELSRFNLNAGNDEGQVMFPSILRRAGALADSSSVPIFELAIIFERATLPPAGFAKIPIDLNEGAGGEFVYLCYRRGKLTPDEAAAVDKAITKRIKEELRRIRAAKLKRRRELHRAYQAVLASLRDGAQTPSTPLAAPPTDAGEALLGMDNAGNTCYIDSLLFSLFGFTTALDACLDRVPSEMAALRELGPFDLAALEASEDAKPKDIAGVPAARSPSEPAAVLRHLLRERVVPALRTGALVTEGDMEELRFALRMRGWERGGEDAMLFGWQATQQDASELLNDLLEWIGAPHLCLARQFALEGVCDPSDVRLEVQRTVPISLPDEPAPAKSRSGKKKKSKNRVADARRSLDVMLSEFLFANALDGYTREVCPDMAAALADARAKRESMRAAADQTGVAAAAPASAAAVWHMVYRLLPHYVTDSGAPQAWPTNGLLLPIVLKRFNNELQKISLAIRIPLEIRYADVPFLTQLPAGVDPDSVALRLRSAVCHSGKKLDRGHYYALARQDLADGTSCWLRFDDLEDVGLKVGRVDIPDGECYATLCRESYICFYEVSVNTVRTQ